MGKVLAGIGLAFLLLIVYELGHGLTLPAEQVDLKVPSGASAHIITTRMHENGINVPGWAFVSAVHLVGIGHHLKPGHYTVRNHDSLWNILQKFRAGDCTVTHITLTEGTRFDDFRVLVLAATDLKHDTADWTEAQVAKAMGLTQATPEGWLAPDTYAIDPDSSDLVVYKRAYQEQIKRLDQAWNQRAGDLPYQSADQALIMASLIEKETGRAADRGQIAAVFINRLRKDMALQTDPSVIYGMGSHYTGHLRKRDLQADTPYNTYTRRGLPPTAIAMPGRDAIQAALHPSASAALFFVARGDGSSVFSSSLDAHNRAVNQFVRHAASH
jgi:UPF0755 protein